VLLLLNDLVIGSNWTGPSSSRQEAPQTPPRSDQVHAETGQTIIDDDNSDCGGSQSKTQTEYTGANLYKEHLTSVHGFTRGPNMWR
jgi:hypothetical protein